MAGGQSAFEGGAQRGIAFAQEPSQCFIRVFFGRGRAEDLGDAGVAQFGQGWVVPGFERFLRKFDSPRHGGARVSPQLAINKVG